MAPSVHRTLDDHSGLLLHQLIDNAYDGIYITDNIGNPLYFNEAFLRISGIPVDAARRLSVWELLDQHFLPNSCVAEVIRRNQPHNTIIHYYSGIEAIVTGIPVYDTEGALLYVVASVRDITELNRLRREVEAMRTQAELRAPLRVQLIGDKADEALVYRSAVMEKILTFAARAATVDSPVMILGESGVGKDVLAKYIHAQGENGQERPFVKINCGAIPAELLESELFGYEGGAFTGANRRGKAGMFELAHRGTIFLDEIGEMPLALQVKLLAVLQDRQVQRIGSTRPTPLDVRVITATNADIKDLLAKKAFRQDLFYRLNVLTVTVPPLRDRREDIPALIAHFLGEYNRKFGLNRYLAPEALQALLDYSWPGNIRQLRNVMERLVVLSEDDRIGVEALPGEITRGDPSAPGQVQERLHPPTDDRLTLREAVAQFERRYLQEQLIKHRTLRECATALGIDVATLVRKKKRYGL
ncbi:MAG: sigma 54-interacting transcriptional regulator [Kyrpidia tusciae]|nr:sigma 54-interacting transcriptional regulator [Kyrpidia tusciae]MBE3553344.1 sigma 54-interacting transcriptional regulator [Kyrpidia tusciae]